MEEKSVRAAVLGLVTGIGNQDEANALVAKQPEDVITSQKIPSLRGRQCARFAGEIADVQILRIGLPPVGV